MIFRLISCLPLFACLAACDQPPAPEPPLGTSPEPQVEQPIAEPEPVPHAEPEPVPAAEPVVVTKKPAPALSKESPPEQRVTADRPSFEFDLRLPQELLDAIEPGETLELEPLLPAFFGRETESDIRLNGRLIESPEEDRLFDGAELKIEIRR